MSIIGRAKKSKSTFFKTVFVIAIVVLAGIWLVNIQYQKWRRLGLSYKYFDLYSVLETCQMYFGDVKLGSSFEPQAKFHCSDDFGNKYTFIVQDKDNLIVYVNNKKLDEKDVDELYYKIFKRVVFETIKKYPPADFESSDPNSVFRYLSGWIDEYKFYDGKHFVSISGMDSLGNFIDIIYEIKRINDKIKIYVSEVFINNRRLSNEGKKIIMAMIYKKKIDKDILEIVRESYFPEFSQAPLGEVLVKVPSGRLYVVNEAKRLVEFNATENSGQPEKVRRIALGFAVEDYGTVQVAYFKIDDVEKSTEEAFEYLRGLYKKFGYLNINEEIEKYKNRVLATKVPNASITFSEFSQRYLRDVYWDVSFSGVKTIVHLKARLKSNDNALEMYIELSRHNEKDLVVSDVYYNNNKSTLTNVLSMILPAELLTQDVKPEQKVDSNENLIISQVKSKLSFSKSVFKTNEQALENFLAETLWSFKNNYVTVSGKGYYAQRRRNFEFVFSNANSSNPIIESIFLDGEKCNKKVADYIIGKIYGFDNSAQLLAQVKNAQIKSSTEKLSNIFKDGKWNVDTKTDIIKYTDGDLLSSFVVFPSGVVQLRSISYKGYDLTSFLDDLIKELETKKSPQEAVMSLASKKSIPGLSEVKTEDLNITDVQDNQDESSADIEEQTSNNDTTDSDNGIGEVVDEYIFEDDTTTNSDDENTTQPDSNYGGNF
ncbi:hypothetical protein [Fervidobacterium sp.]